MTTTASQIGAPESSVPGRINPCALSPTALRSTCATLSPEPTPKRKAETSVPSQVASFASAYQFTDCANKSYGPAGRNSIP